MNKPAVYRVVIDEMVHFCREDQGQIGPNRARAGVWHRDATPDFLPEQHAINALLQRLSAEEREVLAGVLAHRVELGMFEALKVLEQYQVPPFGDGYEGSPCNDFIGRMSGDWDWPEDA